MAELDLTDAFGPEMCSEFEVTRREEIVNSFGESTAKDVPAGCQSGVVTQAGPNDLQRLDDQDRMGRVLSIVTTFPLRGPSKTRGARQYKPDLITFQGDRYIVKDVAPYTHFGPGFVQALAGSIDAIDRPPA